MARFIAYNSALSTTTGIAAGTSYTTGAKCALQLQIPDNGVITLWGFGISMDVAQGTGALIEIASTDTGSTPSSFHTTTTIESWDHDNGGVNSRLTMAGAGATTGYGNGAITSNTTLRMAYRGYVTQALDYIFPLGERPRFGGGTSENFLQFRINTAATVNAVVYMIWDEHI